MHLEVSRLFLDGSSLLSHSHTLIGAFVNVINTYSMLFFNPEYFLWRKKHVLLVFFIKSLQQELPQYIMSSHT